MVKRYDVRMGSRDSRTPARALSGGNQQKVVVARAMDSHPRLVVACQPTRGLDVSATRFVHDILRSARDNGVGVLLFSLDLDEILALSDRVAVMYNGRIAGIVPRGEATPERIGALMTGAGSRSGRAA
jgi:simple sugar transport system ATP-binding protein